MLGIPAEAEIDVHERTTTPSIIGSTATCSTWRSISPAGRRGLAALAEAMRRWIAHLLGVEVDDRAADRAARGEVHLVCRARRRRHPDRRCAVERRGARRGDAPARVVGLFRLTFRDPAIVMDKVQRRAGLSDPGDDAGQAAAHEAAESRHRPADPPSGGGHMSAPPPLDAHSGRRRGRARPRPQAQWIDFTWRPVAVLAGVPDTPPWTYSPTTASARRSMPGAAEIELHRTRDRRTIATISRAARRRCGWCCAPTEAEPPYRARRRHRRSGRGRGLDRRPAAISSSRCRCRNRSATIVAAFVAEHHVERRSSSASATAPTRSRSARRARRHERASHDEPGRFPDVSWSAGRAGRRSGARAAAPAEPGAADAPQPDQAALPDRRCRG